MPFNSFTTYVRVGLHSSFTTAASHEEANSFMASLFVNGSGRFISHFSPSFHVATTSKCFPTRLNCAWQSSTSSAASLKRKTVISATWLALNEPITLLQPIEAAGVMVTALMTSYSGIPRCKSFAITAGRSCAGSGWLNECKSVLMISGKKPSSRQASATGQE